MPIRGVDFLNPSKLGFARRVLGNNLIDTYIRRYKYAVKKGNPTTGITRRFNQLYEHAIAQFYANKKKANK
jgi:hypothetical protein